MEFFFFNRKDKLLGKCNNCFNNVPQPPKTFKTRKKGGVGVGGQKLENWDSSITGSVHCGLKCRFDGTMGRCCWGDVMA